MNVIKNSDIDFDPVFVRRLSEHLNRIRPKRLGSRRARITIPTAGKIFRHNLGAMPVHITIMPLSDFYVWHYGEPDAMNLYLAASAEGDALISVSGE